jgi:hypothetical protein
VLVSRAPANQPALAALPPQQLTRFVVDGDAPRLQAESGAATNTALQSTATNGERLRKKVKKMSIHFLLWLIIIFTIK